MGEQLCSLHGECRGKNRFWKWDDEFSIGHVESEVLVILTWTLGMQLETSVCLPGEIL